MVRGHGANVLRANYPTEFDSLVFRHKVKHKVAVKAVITIQALSTNSNDNTKVDATTKIAIVGNDQGDLETNTLQYEALAVDPTTLTGIKSEVNSACKTHLVNHSVTFGLLDTVLVY